MSLLSMLMFYTPNTNVSFSPHTLQNRRDRLAAAWVSPQGRAQPWPQAPVAFGGESWQPRSPFPQVPALTGFLCVHILIEVMGIIPPCWQTLGPMLTSSLLSTCGESVQSQGIHGEVAWHISSVSRVHVAVGSLQPVILLNSLLRPQEHPRGDAGEEEGGSTLSLRLAKG